MQLIVWHRRARWGGEDDGDASPREVSAGADPGARGTVAVARRATTALTAALTRPAGKGQLGVVSSIVQGRPRRASVVVVVILLFFSAAASLWFLHARTHSQQQQELWQKKIQSTGWDDMTKDSFRFNVNFLHSPRGYQPYFVEDPVGLTNVAVVRLRFEIANCSSPTRTVYTNVSKSKAFATDDLTQIRSASSSRSPARSATPSSPPS
uniref:Uncharacterized protein n=1 Tax=Leersia perrieri TaxID=77586 RepID=A0A0D9X3L4_9ORYZ